MIKQYSKKHDFGELGSVRIDSCVETEPGKLSFTKQCFAVINVKGGQYTVNCVKEVEYNRDVTIPGKGD